MSLFKTVTTKFKAVLSVHESPCSLYRYKGSSTPEEYTGQQIVHAFKLRYDRRSKTTSLQHSQIDNDGIRVEFEVNSPLGGNVDRINGWYVDQQGSAGYDWEMLKRWVPLQTQTELNEKKKKDPFWLQNQDEPWAIRGYFIGPEKSNAPPCITVLCANADMARFLVDCILGKLDFLEGWGATLLPRVKVVVPGSSRGSNDRSHDGDDLDIPDQDPLNAVDISIRIDIGSLGNHFMPTMTNRGLSSWATKKHRCGVHVEIARGSEVIAKATIGGLITVGDEVYGLTVGHLFSPSSTVGEGELQSFSTEIGATMKAWQQGQSCGMEFDWALVKIPGLQKEAIESWDDVNLVRTVSGEFRPVLIALEEPSPYTAVVLATPGSSSCLRGVLVGSGAVVNIPGSPNPYATWVCRMEEPWQILQGDSGSWLLDAQNGMLLGVLVAGCPELHEAYIIPAHEIVDDIKRCYPGDTDHPDLPVNLPNCHPLSITSQIDLNRHFNEYGSIVKSSETFGSVHELEGLDKRIAEWIEKSVVFTDVPSAL